MIKSQGSKFYLSPSKIHGDGVYANKDLRKNEDIDIGIDFYLGGLLPFVTDHFGSWINHSYSPNCYLKYKSGKWYVVASKLIPKDQEVLLDYRKTPWYIAGPEAHYV